MLRLPRSAQPNKQGEHDGGERKPVCSIRHSKAVVPAPGRAPAAGAATMRRPVEVLHLGHPHPPVPADLLHLEQSHGHWAGGVHYCLMEVRMYELDQFQVVNNAIYASYIQHASHKAFASLDMPVEEFQQQGLLMALSDLALQYKAPLRAGGTFYVTTAAAQVSAARLVMQHTVQRVPARSQLAGQQPQVVCTAQATVVFLDASYRPTRLPHAPRQVFQKLAAEYNASA